MRGQKGFARWDSWLAALAISMLVLAIAPLSAAPKAQLAWVATGGAAYTLSATAGVLTSTQAGGSLY